MYQIETNSKNVMYVIFSASSQLNLISSITRYLIISNVRIILKPLHCLFFNECEVFLSVGFFGFSVVMLLGNPLPQTLLCINKKPHQTTKLFSKVYKNWQASIKWEVKNFFLTQFY